VIHFDEPSDAALLPSRVIAIFNVTHGSPVVT
jgi:hypothetical protein